MKRQARAHDEHGAALAYLGTGQGTGEEGEGVNKSEPRTGRHACMVNTVPPSLRRPHASVGEAGDRESVGGV